MPTALNFHPIYLEKLVEWEKFRYTAESGWRFTYKYLRKFSERESLEEFNERKELSYCPAHAKAAVTEVKNSIFQRMVDILRTGGPKSYQEAIYTNVDHNFNSMNSFIGKKVLEELLFVGKVGVFIDRPRLGPIITLEAQPNPYLYTYRAEDILNWHYDEENNLTAVLLRDYVEQMDDFGLVSRFDEKYRLLQLTDEGVSVKFMDVGGKDIAETITLKMSQLPFVIFELSDSLLKDIADYQIAMLNLASSDMNYAMKSNFPFYTEQYKPGASDYARDATDFDSGNEGKKDQAATANEKAITVGATKGRRYPMGVERPSFINPSPEPLKVSMEKQNAMKEEIRELLNLNIATIQTRRASAESKQEDSRTKEEGLSNIGLELEHGERQIANIWAMYEGEESAIITYPTNYSLKSDMQRKQEADRLIDSAYKVNSNTLRKEAAKEYVRLTIGHKVPNAIIDTIISEIEESSVPFADPEIIRSAAEAGFVGNDFASKSLGYPDGEAERAKQDHVDRLRRIAEAQGGELSKERGIKDGI